MASHASLRSTASRQTFETAATRGICFCGEPISPSLSPTASEDEEDAPIYCSVTCARADALQALLAGSSTSLLAAPAMEASLSSDLPTKATFALPTPSAPTQLSATKAKRASRVYPELQFNLESPLEEEECAKWEQEQLVQPRKLLGASSHYRRIQALRPVVDFGPSSDDSDDTHYHSSPSSSRSSAYVSIAPTHAFEERESAHLAALSAVVKGHARKASEQWTTHLTYVPRLGHAHMRSDASMSSISSNTSSGSTWSVPSTQASDRSRTNTLDSSAQPYADALSLDVDVCPPPQVKLAPLPLPMHHEQVLRLELAALDAELDATFRAFEYDDDLVASNINSFDYDLGEGWRHQDPVGWNQGQDNGGLGLKLGLVGPVSTPMPSCDVFDLAVLPPTRVAKAAVEVPLAPVSLLAALELPPMVLTTPKTRARPDLKPIDVAAASLATTHSIFEPYSPLLTPPTSAVKTSGASTLTSLFKRTVNAALSPPPTPQRSSKPLHSSTPTPTRRDSHERELAERLVGRIDAVLRGRWSSAKSPTTLKYADSVIESPRRPSLAHKRSRVLLLSGIV